MNIIVLTAGTVFIVIFSWFLSIKHGRYHGIPRFFAFESILLLLLMNYRAWFTDPFSWNQVVSWILLTGSIYPVISGYLLLRRKGNPGKNFEDTSTLVKSGVYGLIRHPLYLSVFLLGTGIMLKDPGKWQVIAGIVLLVAIYFTARVEEREMIGRFNGEYEQYMKETKMFIPYIL